MVLFDGPHSFLRVSLYGFGLGVLLGGSLVWLFYGPSYGALAVYLVALAAFHQTEYVQTALWKPRELSLDSYLLNHSNEYQIANAAAIVEYLVESFLFPSFKATMWPITVVGVLVLTVGFVVRALAMATARESFNHLVQREKQDDHRLITHGIYSVVRHPAYFGFFWFSVGTQLALCNPVCFVSFCLATFKFFQDRIPEEERHLMKMFPEYAAYKARVPVLIPFIH